MCNQKVKRLQSKSIVFRFELIEIEKETLYGVSAFAYFTIHVILTNLLSINYIIELIQY